VAEWFVPVAGGDPLRVNGLDAALGGPVVLEGGALREVLLDLVQRDDPARLGGEQFVPDSLHFAAKLQVGLQAKHRCQWIVRRKATYLYTYGFAVHQFMQFYLCILHLTFKWHMYLHLTFKWHQYLHLTLKCLSKEKNR
jgi:hypothetical protein